MARANNKGWDFVKVGEYYQYKEGSFIARVTVLEDKSTPETYIFRLQTEESNYEAPTHDGEPVGVFTISHDKDPGGYWNDMPQFFEEPEYTFVPTWDRRYLKKEEQKAIPQKDNFNEFKIRFNELVTGKFDENDIQDHYVEYKKDTKYPDAGVWLNDRLDLHSNAIDSYWLKPVIQGGLVVEQWAGDAINADGETEPSVFLEINESLTKKKLIVIISKSELERFAIQLENFEIGVSDVVPGFDDYPL